MVSVGFRVCESIVQPADLDALLRAISTRPRSRAGARHLLHDSVIAEFASRPDLLDLVREWLGPGAVPFRATLFDKSAARNWLVVWHQDTALPMADRFNSPDWGPWSVKAGIHYAHAPTAALATIVALRVHIDDCTSANGPLRVIPGTHELGVLSDSDVSRISRERRAVECVVHRGGVLVMSPLLIHSSSKALSPSPRRVLHLEYAASLDLAEGTRLAIA